MGLASSQARLLNLTSRMHQIEYNAARLEAQKLQMANESRQVYLEYQDALEKTKVQIKKLNSDGSVTYSDMSSYDDFLNAGFALVYDGSVYDSSTGLDEVLSDIIDKQNGTTGSVASYSSFEQAITNVINSGYVTIVQKMPDGSFPTDTTSNEFADYETSVAINTGLQEITDESGLRKAEAKYEADMRRIDMKDRKYDYDLAALENERNAVKNEMETLKTVAGDNVERTFKLFS